MRIPRVISTARARLGRVWRNRTFMAQCQSRPRICEIGLSTQKVYCLHYSCTMPTKIWLLLQFKRSYTFKIWTAIAISPSASIPPNIKSVLKTDAILAPALGAGELRTKLLGPSHERSFGLANDGAVQKNTAAIAAILQGTQRIN